MRNHNGMRPQDIAILVKMVVNNTEAKWPAWWTGKRKKCSGNL